MPSTRGMGSKIICCCSLALFGTISVKLISPNVSLLTILRPCDSGVVNGIAFLRQLHHNAKLDRALRDPVFDFIEEEIRRLCCRPRVVQIFVARYR